MFRPTSAAPTVVYYYTTILPTLPDLSSHCHVPLYFLWIFAAIFGFYSACKAWSVLRKRLRKSSCVSVIHLEIKGSHKTVLLPISTLRNFPQPLFVSGGDIQSVKYKWHWLRPKVIIDWGSLRLTQKGQPTTLLLPSIISIPWILRPSFPRILQSEHTECSLALTSC